MLKLLNILLDFIFKKSCYLCKTSTENSILCSQCFSNLPQNKLKKFYNEYFNISFYAAGVYDGDLKKLIRGLKFHNQKELAKYLAQFMYNYWIKLNIPHQNLVIIAVPQYFKTRKPYNHAKEIAEEFSKLTGFKTDFELIKRVKKTKPQYKLTKIQREENLKDAFKLTKEVDTSAVYLIIDDIITTSATVNQMIKTLNVDNYLVFCASMTGAYLK